MRAQSGVYVILGRMLLNAPWNILDVGESADVRASVFAHDRAPEWRRQDHALLEVAAIYADERNRMLIERQLRLQFNPPCGVY